MSDAGPSARRFDAPAAAYQVLLELGRGGMGMVHLARAQGAARFERLVVVKRLKPGLLDNEHAVERFLDEARIAARVHHANVIGTHYVGDDEQGPFLVLDYVEGGSLDQLLDKTLDDGELIPPAIILRIALDALQGLHAVHVAQDATGQPLNILHRDVSLQNVLIGRDGVARIADFGIAKSALASVSTDKSYLVGKLLYMAPEYVRRDPVGPSIDVYALGMTLWLALSGREPWPDASEAQLLKHILDDRTPDLSDVMQIPPQISSLIARAVEKAPGQRFPNARAMAQSIEQLVRDTNWVASHAEVAAFVDAKLGPELARRRTLLAQRIAAADAQLAPPRPEVRAAPGASAIALHQVPAELIEAPRRRSRALLVSVVVTAVAAGAAILAFGARLSRSGDSATPVLRSAPELAPIAVEQPSPNASGAISLPPNAAPTPHAGAAPTASPVLAPTDASAARPSTHGVRKRSTAADSRSGAAATVTADPSAAPSPAVPAPAAVAPNPTPEPSPTHELRKNPYR